MSYRLHEPLPAGLRRIIREQLGQALATLNDQDADLDEAVHDARKRLKKTRAVLRIVRGVIDKPVFERENAAFRDAGRLMSDLRDSAVLLDTLHTLRAEHSDLLSTAVFSAAKAGLADRYDHSLSVYTREGRHAKVVAAIQAGCDRVAGWPIDRDDFDALRGGLKRVYKRGVKRMAEAYTAPSPETFHEWRKRVKYLWYHTRILRNLWPEILGARAQALHELADQLGDAHDLAELKHALQQPDLKAETPAFQRLISLIDRNRVILHTRAHPLGQRIYQEKPKRFVKRMAGYWAIWRATPAMTFPEPAAIM